MEVDLDNIYDMMKMKRTIMVMMTIMMMMMMIVMMKMIIALTQSIFKLGPPDLA